MIREEEDDMTQELRALILVEANQISKGKIERAIAKMESEKPPTKDEYTMGVSDGLEWAIRILSGDKSAS